MAERTVTVSLEVGLHARPAAEFVRLAAASAADVTIAKDGREVNAKSILAVLGLDVRHGTEIRLASADAAVLERLAGLVSDG